jgi:hypothetical protein
MFDVVGAVAANPLDEQPNVGIHRGAALCGLFGREPGDSFEGFAQP